MMLAIAFLALFVAWRRGKLPKDRALWIPLASFPSQFSFSSSPSPSPSGMRFPKLRFLQFPWRWLVALEAPMGIFFAAAIWPARLWVRNLVDRILHYPLPRNNSCLARSCSIRFCDADDRVSGMLAAYRKGQGFEGVDEYAPPRADNTLVAIGLPDACLSTNAATVLAAAASDGTIPEWDPANGHCDATYSWIRRNGQIRPNTAASTLTFPTPAFSSCICAITPHGRFASTADCSPSAPTQSSPLCRIATMG